MRQFRSKYLGKRTLSAFAIAAASCLMAACGNSSDSGSVNLSPTARAAALGENLMVRVEIDTNDAAKTGINCANLGADWASCARGKLILENTGTRSLAAGGWTLYVHSIRRILMVDHPAFSWKHITGDLYALTPRLGAFTLGAGERLEVPFVGEYWYQRYSDLLPRAYVVADGGAAPTVLRQKRYG
jgi:hexosaminidase